MKLSKAEIADLMKAYNAYWDSYIGGDIKKIESLLDQGYTQIGSAETEVFFSKKAAIKFMSDTIDQVVGQIELRNREIKKEFLEESVLLTDLSDIYVLTEGNWVFYAKFRASSLLQQENGKWKFRHQHSSFPDIRTEEGDNIAIQKVAAENIELKDAIKRSTVQLEHKNRELEIEAALERVRARSMAMHKSEELSDAAVLLYDELRGLGLTQYFNCGYVAVNESENKQYVWNSSFDGKWLEGHFIPLTGDVVFNERYEAWKQQVPVFHQTVGGKILKKHIEFVSTILPRKIEEQTRSGFRDPTVFYCCNFGKGYLHIITDRLFNGDEESLLDRFTKVFEQTYTRFLDLQKAEAQAREAEIEAALERIRGQAIGMNSSSDLPKVVNVFYEEITRLQLSNETTDIELCLVDKGLKTMRTWSAASNFSSPEQLTSMIELNKVPVLKKQFLEWKKQPPELRKNLDLAFECGGKTWQKMLENLSTHPDWSEGIKVMYEKNIRKWYWHHAYNQYGSVVINSAEPIDPTSIPLLKRVSQVFEQTYTRFLDLQRAEAQAREAQIEAALERVRSRSLAMQKSDELAEVVATIYEQLTPLGFAPLGCELILCDEENGQLIFWSATPEQSHLPECYPIDRKIHPFFKQVWKAWKNRAPRSIITLKGAEKRKFDNLIFEKTAYKALPEKVKRFIRSGKVDVFSLVTMKYGLLESVDDKPLTEDKFPVLERFAKVFEQTYTRFLDLQKAEAQAREAQIEAALERVRAASMAMHRSENLVEVATVLHNELRSLNVREFSQTSIVVHDEPNGELVVWGARTGAASLEKSVFPLLGDQILQKLYDKWLQQDDFFTLKVKGAALRKHIDFVYPKASRSALEKKAITGMPDPTFFHCAFFCMGYLELMADKELSGDSSSLLVRFAKVFDQAYIRFLDLQKAEAQAREAQIEAALERVRSAALGMHESKDLHKIVNVVLSEMGSLEISMSSALIHEFRDETRDMYFWPATPEIMYPEIVHLPYIKHQWFTRFHQARKESESFYTDLLSKKEKNRNWRHYFKHSPVPEDRQKFLLSTPAISLSTALFENTAITMLRYDVLPFSDDENAILKRFGQVFQQAYQRFLDLRKAESQAREAQIEAALERVRAKALAMHSSDELVDVSLALREQMAAIGQDQLETIAIHFIPKDSAHFSAWFAFHPPAKEVGEIQFGAVDFSKTETYYARKFIQLYNSNRSDYLIEASGQHLDEWQKMLMDRVPVFKELWINDVPNHQYWYFSDFSGGNLMLITLKQADTEALELLRRSAQVFDLAYRRYIDLKKAEAQAREAQIEAALERIRARALAMHSSSELMEVANVMREQMGLLQQPELEASVIHLYDDNPNELESWFAMRPPGQKKGDIITGTARFSNSAITRESIKAHKSKGTEYTLRYSGAKLKEWINNLKVQAPVIFEAFKGDFPRQHVYHYSDFSGGALLLVSHEEPSEEAKELQKRAAAVFDLAYRRYLDLKKSEEQAREAEIELALERVRARTMAMQHSNELAETASLLFQQVSKLGVELWGCSFNIWEPGDTSFTSWWGGRDLEIKSSWYIPLTEDPIFMLFDASRKRGDKLWVEEAGGEKLMARYQYMLGLPDVGAHLQGLLKAGITFPTFQIDHIVNFKHGNVLFITYEPHPQAYDIFERFAKVFEQTYTRFLDLQKAEAQAREAEIEAALERVRSKTMAMHNSDDVGETIVALFDEVLKLGIDDSIRCGIGIIDGPESIHLEVWSATSSPDGEVDLKTGKVNMMIHPALIGGLEAWKSGKSGFTYELIGKDVHTYYNAINNEPEYPFDIDLNTLPENNFLNNFNFSDGLLFAFTEKSISAEGVKVLDRFAGVFSQTYRRYLDLQKAEAQAREAQIEAALERVRSKTMGMHNSKDLEDIVITLFEEVLNLGLDRALRCGIGILEDFEGMETRSVNASADGTVELRVGMLNMTIHPMLVGLKKAWKKGEQGYSYYYTKKDVRKYYEALNNEPEYPFNANLETLPKQEFHRSFFFSSGILFAFSETPISEESSHILARFAAVFGQTYRRYLDLQKAELREQQAVKQASIDRLRAEIASMRNTDDLDRITPLIWKELTTLGVPFFRCGVFIVKEDLGELRVYLSTPEGKSLAAWHSDLDALPLFENIVEYWRNKKVYHEKWNRSQFKSFSKTLRDQGIIDDIKTYQAAETPPKSLDLRFVPFLQGMLYVGSSEPLSENHIDIIHGLAEAFSVAYARYEDFKQLGDTLDELKSTQSQLIQSEKMASLGELTAGIAHEIQNPLNFVNNFSEVSGELIDELQEEIDAGNLDDVKDISGDLKQNLEKINEHGKRASGIVKGMLEHSRTGDGVKELTDINKLADEYLRLAFHGLRAKDKSFNADFKMEFDEALPKIKVVPQDMGRVLLNLINNAFFAVSSKLEARSPDYKPEVIVSTKRNDKSIIVSVKDNGPGIPDEIKDKIFQPFFTTKPTGSGTGLGLSMSYDIITKGHGGNLSVKSEAGKGTIFEIQLPN